MHFNILLLLLLFASCDQSAQMLFFYRFCLAVIFYFIRIHLLSKPISKVKVLSFFQPWKNIENEKKAFHADRSQLYNEKNIIKNIEGQAR